MCSGHSGPGKERQVTAMALPAGPILDALGDPTRRQIFERLGRGPLPVNEIAAGLPITRPAVSQHLKVLKQAGLVLDRAEGTRRIYQASPAALQALRDYLERGWEGAAAAPVPAPQAPAARDPHRARPRAVVRPDLDWID
jgi:DNA-binding transcriptional ArsR family regulator